MSRTAESMEEKPRRGDLVKLIGNHRYAGCTGVYFTDRHFYSRGELYPVVRIKYLGNDVETFVMDPENQMRKL
jgi:hypothetical protein